MIQPAAILQSLLGSAFMLLVITAAFAHHDNNYFQGVNYLQTTSVSLNSFTSMQSLRKIKANGADSVALIAFMQQDTPASSRIQPSNAVTDRQLTQAIADFNEAIMANPEASEIFYQRGLAYAAQKNYHYAVEDFNQALMLSPQNADVIYQKALAYANLGQPVEAIESLNLTLRLNPTHAAAFYQRGRAYYEQSNYTQAMQDFNQALSLKPDDQIRAWSLYYRGLTFTHRGEHQEPSAGILRQLEKPVDDCRHSPHRTDNVAEGGRELFRGREAVGRILGKTAIDNLRQPPGNAGS